MSEKNYESTVMRIAGNLLSGHINRYGWPQTQAAREDYAVEAVALARAIVAEVKRTAPPPPAGDRS